MAVYMEGRNVVFYYQYCFSDFFSVGAGTGDSFNADPLCGTKDRWKGDEAEKGLGAA